MAASGPSFFEGENGGPMFTFVIDSGNIIGPRPVTASDKVRYTDLWLAYERAHEAPVEAQPPEPAIEPDPVPEVVAAEAPEVVDSASTGRPEPAPAETVVTKATIVAALTAAGVEFDARQSRDKLAAILAALPAKAG